MTYKEIVDSVAQAVADHKILRDFGYGAITDIKTVNTDQESTTVDYPYVFLNPTQGSRNGQAITYRWNLIAMDVVQEDPDNTYLNYLKVQSDCQQYVDDILAYLRFSTPLKDFDLTLNVQLTPFKERFQDSVAGMTATLEVEIPQKLDNCLTPFYPGDLLVKAVNNTAQPFSTNGYISASTIITDTYSIWNQYGNGEIANFAAWADRPNPLPTVWESWCTIRVTQAPTQEEWNEFRDWRLNVGLSQNNPVCVVEGLSATPPQLDDVINFKVSIEYNITTETSAGLQLRDAFPGEPWATLFEQVDSQIRIYQKRS